MKIFKTFKNKILTPDTLLTFNKINSQLIEFDNDYFKSSKELTFTKEEENLLFRINEISVNTEYDNTIPDDDIGFAGVKLNQLGITTYIFLVIGIIISITIIFGGFYMLKKDKKPPKISKKKKN